MFDHHGAANNITQNQQSLQSRFDNMKNQFTPGYKAEVVEFNEIMSSKMGGGAKVKSTSISFDQGKIFKTQTKTNMALNGRGFFVVSDGNQKHYTRDGRFEFKEGSLKDHFGKSVVGFPLDTQGNISGQEGPVAMTMDPNTKLYAGKYTDFKIDDSGKVYGIATLSDPTTGQRIETTTPLYQVAVASFANASSLERTGTTSFQESEESGDPMLGVAGQGALGAIKAGSLELSNVDYMREGAAIGMTKQNYQANMAAFKAMDQLTKSALGLVR